MSYFFKCAAIALFAAAYLVSAGAMEASAVKPGIIVKSTAGKTIYYVTPTGALAGIPSEQAFSCLKLSNQDFYNMGPEKINALKKVPLLFRSPAGKIYLIEGTQKRHVASPAAFQKNGYNEADVVRIEQSRLDCLPDGKPVN